MELSKNYVLMYEWFTSWYNSAISFALVEVNARTSSQIQMMFVIYVINAMINAYLIGVFIDQFSVKNEKRQMKQEQLDELSQAAITEKHSAASAHGKLEAEMTALREELAAEKLTTSADSLF